MEEQLLQLDSQASIETERVTKQNEQVERFKPSVKSGLIPRTQFIAQEDQLLASQSELHRINGLRIDLRHQIEEKRQTTREIPIEFRRFAQQTDSQLADISLQITQNEAKRLTVITAPASGRVTAVLAKTGQGVTSGQTVLSILPDGAKLEAQLLVPSRAIASVQRGSAVAIRYTAFPYQQFGVQLGKVESVSTSALGPKEIEQITGKSSDDPLYRVYVNIDGQRLPIEQLTPGMTLTGDILMERRTLLEWALEPIYGLRVAIAGSPGEKRT
jgi:membrane fusion protein